MVVFFFFFLISFAEYVAFVFVQKEAVRLCDVAVIQRWNGIFFLTHYKDTVVIYTSTKSICYANLHLVMKQIVKKT